MTFRTLPRRKDKAADNPFETKLERALRGADTVFVLDDGIILRIRDGTIETTS
ncbi:hypothetical protein [Rhodopseudomonas sp.]|uniref:hypothetical protein n=1 Tax=Rhodopseudomonas sp. TaxID=1078 RepID=UPI003B3A693D